MSFWTDNVKRLCLSTNCLRFSSGGAVHASGNHSTRGTDVYLSGFVELTDSNYVQMKVFQNSGASAQYAYGDTTGFQNFFEIFKIAS